MECVAVEQALTWPEFSAGRMMQRELVMAPEHWTVGQTIEDRDGNMVEETRPQATDAIRADTAYIVTSLLRGVVERGTATRAKRLERPIAGKTGREFQKPLMACFQANNWASKSGLLSV